jgi:hypothetical protein
MESFGCWRSVKVPLEYGFDGSGERGMHTLAVEVYTLAVEAHTVVMKVHTLVAEVEARTHVVVHTLAMDAHTLAVKVFDWPGTLNDELEVAAVEESSAAHIHIPHEASLLVHHRSHRVPDMSVGTSAVMAK